MNEQLDNLTAFEMDMCFKARVYWVFETLKPKPEDLILDIGCGRAFYGEYFRRAIGCKYIGVEFDWEIIKQAKTNVTHEKEFFVQGSADMLPIPNSSLDKILLSEVLEHTKDDGAVLNEIYRILKPGGILALTVPNSYYPFCWDPINWLLSILKLPPIRQTIFAGVWANHERLYTKDEIISLASKAGFKINKTSLLTRFCFPFMQFIVYGIGKELLVRGWIPKSLAKSVNRYASSKDEAKRWGIISLIRCAFIGIDYLNQIIPPRKSSIAIAVVLERPR